MAPQKAPSQAASGQSWVPTSAVTDGLNKDPAIDAVTGQFDGRKNEAPYRVPKTRIEEDFG
ncbi:hypothetical protein SY2F82_65780 [Streptomyces sp. Y2F8-2]|nr:hypothetical protein SY2F82_65780 [Streptomyces sp. Y2F8-2]